VLVPTPRKIVRPLYSEAVLEYRSLFTSARKAAEVVGLSHQTILTRAKKGKIPGVVIEGNRVLIPNRWVQFKVINLERALRGLAPVDWDAVNDANSPAELKKLARGEDSTLPEWAC
jgi:hypothetical protein